MRYSVKLIEDIPYAKFSQKTIRLTADDLDSLITEVIPKRTYKEVVRLQETVWKKIGWKHVNLKYQYRGKQIEFVIDQEKKSVAAVYISVLGTHEELSRSNPAIEFTGEKSLADEVAKRAKEANLLGHVGTE